MAHRLEFTKDITLPTNIQQYRLVLQKQIKQLRQRQQLLSQQHKQKLLILQKRLLYGKKKIFSFDSRKMTNMTLNDQLQHYNLQIEELKKSIARQQQLVHDREKQRQALSQLPQLKLQYYPSRMVLPGVEHQQQQQSSNIERNLSSSPLRIIKKKSLSIVGINNNNIQSSQKSIKNTFIMADPQQQLLALTHEIMRLKKSLQQVRSKYSDNFTQYKLRQQYQKLKQHNYTMTQQLKQYQTNKSINQYKRLINYDVDYDQIQVVTTKRQYQLLMRDKLVLEKYLQKVLQEKEQNEVSSKVKTMEYNSNKINVLNQNIGQLSKDNQIIENQLLYIQKEIKQRQKYQNKLRAKLPA